jgi:hypothetical protein
MKKNLLYLILTLITVISCERDDICLDDVTPNLIIRFYDYENQTELKSISIDSIKINGFEIIDDYTGVSTDSLTVPLNVSEAITKFILNEDTTEETITFSYDRFDEFVSRSCGYRTIFDNLAIQENSQNWIQQIEIVNSTINNEEKAHVYIYH